MSTNNQIVPVGFRVSQSHKAQQAIAKLRALEATFELPDAVPNDRRRVTYLRSKRHTATVLESIATLASQHGGKVVGVEVDPNDIRETLAYAAAMEPLAVACEQLARRIRDHVLQKRALSAVRVSAALAALESMGRLDEAGLNTDLLTVRAAKPRRRKKTGSVVAQPAVPSPIVTPKLASLMYPNA